MEADLRLAFEPPQYECIQVSAFLSLEQGRMSVLECNQRACPLIISCIATHRIGMATRLNIRCERELPAFLLDAEAPGHARSGFRCRSSRRLQQSGVTSLRNLSGSAPEPESMEVDAIQSLSQRHHHGRRTCLSHVARVPRCSHWRKS